MRELLRDYFDGRLSRRGFFGRLVATGLTASAARSIVEAAGAGAVESAPAEGTAVFTGTGAELLAEQIRAAGTRYVFTNPGSTEVGFFDALTDRPELQVVVGLHEGIVIGMADAYHKLSRQPTFVNVHAAVGTAQMGGQLYNAHYDGSGLIITAGMNDGTTFSDEVSLGPTAGFSQAEITREFTKLSWDVRNSSSTAIAVRRAYKLASTAPGGPVYLAISTRAFAEPAKGEVWPKETFLIDARPRPAAEQVQALARMLVEAQRPVVMIGDEVYKADAVAEALAFCDMLGLPMTTAGLSGFQFVSAKNPLFLLSRYGTGNKPYPYNGADLIVQLGTRDPGASVIPDGPIREAGTRYAAVGLDTNMLGRTRALDLAVVGHVKETLRDLADAVSSLATKDRIAKIREDRMAVIRPATKATFDERLDRAKKAFGQTPIHPDRLGYDLDQFLDKDAVIVTENMAGVAGKHDFLDFGPGRDHKLGISHGGGSLGWGVGAAVGAKLAAPDRQVVLSIGDGSVMYSAGGFWSMARHSTPVLTVVWNNHDYQTVRNAGYRYGKRMKDTGHYHGLYLGDPDIDFVKLAESQGVKGRRVTNPNDIAAALRTGTAEVRAGSPYVIEFDVARVGGGADSTWYQKVRPEGTRTATQHQD